eukprot:Em0023g315a
MAARDKKLNQKHLQILLDLLGEEENKICADCQTKGPRWASWNLGIFICIRCAGIHRNLGVHISRVKSVNLDAWTEEQIESMQAGGNKRALEIYEKELPPHFRRPTDDSAVENFIRAKYVRKQYVGKDTPSVSTRVESASDNSKPKDKPKKTATAPTKSTQLDAPRTRPSHQHRASELPDVHALKVDKPRRVESSPDLVSLDSPAVADVTPTPAPPVFAQQQPLDHLFSVPAPVATPAPAKAVSSDPPPLMAVNTPSVKDSILSLYNTQPTNPAYAVGGAYVANGLPMNPVYYQQQQAMAMQMAQQQQAVAQQQQAMAMQMAQQQQLLQIQQQMDKLKLQQQQQQQRVDATGAPSGQTLNPQLW